MSATPRPTPAASPSPHLQVQRRRPGAGAVGRGHPRPDAAVCACQQPQRGGHAHGRHLTHGGGTAAPQVGHAPKGGGTWILQLLVGAARVGLRSQRNASWLLLVSVWKTLAAMTRNPKQRSMVCRCPCHYTACALSHAHMHGLPRGCCACGCDRHLVGGRARSYTGSIPHEKIYQVGRDPPGLQGKGRESLGADMHPPLSWCAHWDSCVDWSCGMVRCTSPRPASLHDRRQHCLTLVWRPALRPITDHFPREARRAALVPVSGVAHMERDAVPLP